MKLLFNLYALTLALFAIYCAVLMTEPGQMIGVPRDWVLGYYRYMAYFWALQLAALALLWVANARGRFWHPAWMVLASLGVLVTFWAESLAMPTAFPTQQFNAEYYSVGEADALIPEEDSRVYVVELNGEGGCGRHRSRGHPRSRSLPCVASRRCRCCRHPTGRPG